MKKVYCAACRSYFASDTMFEEHRTGEYGSTGKSKRRCLTCAEMQQKGWLQQELPVTHYIDDSPKELLRLVWITPERLADREKKKERAKQMRQQKAW